MTLQVEFWQLLTLMVSFLGFVFAAGRVLLSQTDKRLDQRFESLETIRKEAAGNWENKFTTIMNHRRAEMDRHREELAEYRAETKGFQELEREFLKFRAALPIEYVRREDYVRNQTVIEAKLDALALKIENLQLKGVREC
jgi:hypothetical protein